MTKNADKKPARKNIIAELIKSETPLKLKDFFIMYPEPDFIKKTVDTVLQGKEAEKYFEQLTGLMKEPQYTFLTAHIKETARPRRVFFGRPNPKAENKHENARRVLKLLDAYSPQSVSEKSENSMVQIARKLVTEKQKPVNIRFSRQPAFQSSSALFGHSNKKTVSGNAPPVISDTISETALRK